MLSALSREGSSPDSDGRRASPPTKLDKLRFAGYSTEFLDRVETNGNTPDRYALGIRKPKVERILKDDPNSFLPSEMMVANYCRHINQFNVEKQL